MRIEERGLIASRSGLKALRRSGSRTWALLHASNKSNKFVPIIIDYVNKNEGSSLKILKMK